MKYHWYALCLLNACDGIQMAYLAAAMCCIHKLLKHVMHAMFCRFIDQEQQIQGYEQLRRRLLLLPHQPAVVVVHWWSPVHDCIVSQQVSRDFCLNL